VYEGNRILRGRRRGAKDIAALSYLINEYYIARDKRAVMRYVTRFSLRVNPKTRRWHCRVQWNTFTLQFAHLAVHPQDMLEATLNEAATLKRLLDGMRVLQSHPGQICDDADWHQRSKNLCKTPTLSAMRAVS
jgi:hypothetical protein